MNIGWVHRLQGDDRGRGGAAPSPGDGLESGAGAERPGGAGRSARRCRECSRAPAAGDRDHRPTTSRPGILGVLESGTGPVGLFAGQRWLATGLRLGTELSAEQLSYRTDERIYRVVVRPGGTRSRTRPHARDRGPRVRVHRRRLAGSPRSWTRSGVRSTTRARRPFGKGSRRDIDNASRAAFARWPGSIRGWVVRLSWLPLTVLLALGAWTNSIAVAGDATVASFVLLAAAAVLAIFYGRKRPSIVSANGLRSDGRNI